MVLSTSSARKREKTILSCTFCRGHKWVDLIDVKGCLLTLADGRAGFDVTESLLAEPVLNAGEQQSASTQPQNRNAKLPLTIGLIMAEAKLVKGSLASKTLSWS